MVSSIQEIIGAVPQQRPFRFIDEIVEISDDHVIGSYRFREDESFYSGHFPGNPVTPGVILIETMAQIGVIPLALRLMSATDGIDLNHITTLFTEVNVDFHGLVRPGERVVVKSKKIYFRRLKLKVQAEMTRAKNSELLCSGELAGLGVRQT